MQAMGWGSQLFHVSMQWRTSPLVSGAFQSVNGDSSPCKGTNPPPVACTPPLIIWHGDELHTNDDHSSIEDADGAQVVTSDQIRPFLKTDKPHGTYLVLYIVLLLQQVQGTSRSAAWTGASIQRIVDQHRQGQWCGRPQSNAIAKLVRGWLHYTAMPLA